MKRHVLLILFRVLLAFGVLCALPFSHMNWGEPYPGDGQEAFGMIMVFTIIGAGCAVVYFAVGGAVQFFLRRRAWRWTAISDVSMFLVLAGLLIYGGIAARYSDNAEQGAALNGGPATPV